jgi:NHL repeat
VLQPSIRRFTPRKLWAYTLAVAAATVTAVLGMVVVPAGAAGFSGASFVSPSTTVKEVGSTIPGNMDVNPYGVAVVRQSTGKEVAGDVLVSNFNDGPPPTGHQGLGTTIVEMNPSAPPTAPGTASVFAAINPTAVNCPGGVGLTTALSILPGGWVIVGSLPTTDGSTISGSGCLIVLNSNGQVAETFSGGNINGPWDMTSFSLGPFTDIFFTNVLNGTVAGGDTVTNQGTVVRDTLFTPFLGMPRIISSTIIGSGFSEELNPTALVVGPTGVALGNNGNLYVADTVNSKIDAIPFALFRPGSAGTGLAVSSGGDLNGPLGLATTLNGDLLAVNGGDGNLVALSPSGHQIGEKLISPGGPGALFGLAVDFGRLYFVDDSENQLNVLN